MSPLRQRLLDWMNDLGAPPCFESTAIEVFRFQFEANEPYRRYAAALGRFPDQVTRWQDIPAVPTDAFKFPRYPLRCFPTESTRTIFRTSGTTREIRGEHAFDDLRLYETSILRGWERANLPTPENPWFLSQNPDNARDSSLVHMFETLLRHQLPESDDRWMITPNGEIETGRFVQATHQPKPIAFFSTAIGLLRLMETHPPIPLPPGSWIFETGGYKGLRVELDPPQFRQKVSDYFNIPTGSLLNEYGMTELSSPFYAWGGELHHRGSPWTRIQVIEPDTGRPSTPGEPGYLQIHDLANLGSVAAIRTQDLAIAHGDSTFTLLGRDPGALPRGCSRRADDLLSRP